MSRPRFPTQNFADIITRPGATNHAAAKDIPRRLADLERLAVTLMPTPTTAGSVLTSDTSQTGGVAWQYPHQFHLYLSAASTTYAATTAYQTISWTAETYDSASGHSLVTNTSRYTVPTTGWWLLGYEILETSGAYGATVITFNGRVLVSGTTQHLVHTTTHSGTGQPALTKTQPVYLTAGQYIEVQHARSDGFSPALIGGDQAFTNFWGRLVSTA